MSVGRRFRIAKDVRTKFIFSFVWSLYLVVSLGLATGVGIGIADNGDGARVFSPAGLNPISEQDGLAKGQGYVVTEFVAGSKRELQSVTNRIANMHLPTLNSYVLTALGVLSPDRSVSLFTLGWIYLGIGLILIWLIPLGKGIVPVGIVFGALALAPYARWVVSTYADTPAFFGVAAVLSAFVLGLRSLCSREFIQVNALLLLGSLLIALSKAAYGVAVPFILVMWAILLLVFQRGNFQEFGRLPLLSTLAGGLALIGIASFLQFTSSDREQAGKTNAHHFVMDIAIPYFPPEVVDRYIPENIQQLAPERYWPRADEWRFVDGWTETFGNQGDMNRLRLYTFRQPETLVQMVSDTVVASTKPDISYTPANTWKGEEPPAVAVVPAYLYIATTGFVELLLFPLSFPIVNLFFFGITATGALLITVYLRRKDSGGEASIIGAQLALLMWASGLLGGLFAGAAVLGDGYQELEKHAILSSFVFTIYLMSLVVLGGIALASALTRVKSHQLNGRGVATPENP